ncbi:MAG: hypothetical protein FWC76_04345 [Defluviitaleaceae bacterium]|nr:hypothetical protein [Defluviitaleaceae bacterium]
MKTLLNEAREILSKIDFDGIWPGFACKEVPPPEMLTDADDADLLAAHLVREMFRDFLCQQDEHNFEAYPRDLDNYRLKMAENHYLVKACMEQSMMDLQQFVVLREARRRIIGEAMGQELRAETAEGLVEYASLSALNQISRTKFMDKIEGHLKALRNPESLMDMRFAVQSSGCIICFTLKMLGVDFWRNIAEIREIYGLIPQHPNEIDIIYSKIVGE